MELSGGAAQPEADHSGPGEVFSDEGGLRHHSPAYSGHRPIEEVTNPDGGGRSGGLAALHVDVEFASERGDGFDGDIFIGVDQDVHVSSSA